MSTLKKKIAIVGTFDTKFEEMGLIKEYVKERGHIPIIIDAGTGYTGYQQKELPYPPDISRDQVAEALGTTVKDILALNDDGKIISLMGQGAAKIVRDLYEKDQIDGVVSVGGTMGTTVGLAVMKDLPVGLPKIMVSTIAMSPLVTSGDFIAKDQVMVQMPCDLWGINVINKNTLLNAAGAIVGMAEAATKIVPKKPLIAITTRGHHKHAHYIKPALEAKGYEVVVFHVVGRVGGGSYEVLVRQGLFTAVLDFVIGEILCELNGGLCAAGPTRLEAAGDLGIPQVVSMGSLSNWHWVGGPKTFLPERQYHYHNPLVLCVKATVEEVIKAGEVIAEKLNRAKGPVTVLYPKKGWDDFDKEDGVFYFPDGHIALLEVLKKNLKPSIKIVEFDNHINDKAFSDYVIAHFDELIKKA